MAFDWIYVNLPELIKDCDADVLSEIMVKHDNSKWDGDEYFAYCEYFYENKSEALFMGKKYSALAFNFGPDEANYYIIDEYLFQTLLDKTS